MLCYARLDSKALPACAMLLLLEIRDLSQRVEEEHRVDVAHLEFCVVPVNSLKKMLFHTQENFIKTE